MIIVPIITGTSNGVLNGNAIQIAGTRVYFGKVGGAMTNAEAIEWLIQIKGKYIHDGDEQFDAKRKEVLDMAIEALRKEENE